MNIGNASQISGLPVKTIRYYEEIDLVSPGRSENGYRDYGEDDLHRLRFLQRSRSLGFSIDECRGLLSLYKDKNRASSDVKKIALEKISQIDEKVLELQSLRKTLSDLVGSCHGDDRPDCPIMDDLSGENANA
jgi:Cu(I)-responsive transcriptional regulator